MIQKKNSFSTEFLNEKILQVLSLKMIVNFIFRGRKVASVLLRP